jgi:translation initiation factor 4A
MLDHNQTLDSQIKTSPFLHDILDRVIRTEYAQRDLSRELGVLTNKINFLVERLEHADARRSFSASPIPGIVNHNMAISPLGGGNGIHRDSISGNGGREDGDISKRLDALTSSVQQILMIQQHGHNSNGNNGSHHHPPFHGNGPLSPPGGVLGPSGFDGMPSNMNMGNGSGIMGGPPNRPHSRNPPPPVRTWSAGSLDMPLRGDAHLSRPELLNQKRRSVVGNLNRRDSAAVRILLCPMVAARC